MTVAPLQIKFIEIKGLFRQYHHVIPLNLEEHVTILHGRNGVGKTVTLSLVAALLQEDYAKLLKVPFELLRVEFTDGSVLEAIPIKVEQAGILRYAVSRSGSRSGSASVSRRSGGIYGAIQEALASTQVRKQPRLELRCSLAGATSSSVMVSEDGFISDEESGKEVDASRLKLPIHFIEAQRLFRFARAPAVNYSPAPPSIAPNYPIKSFDFPALPVDLRMGLAGLEETAPVSVTAQVTPSVKEIREEIVKRIKITDSFYRATSTRLDNSLPARMFDPKLTQENLASDELIHRAKALEIERSRLREIGLVADTSSFDPSRLNDTQSAMFAVYLKDNEEKLGVFKDLADRAEILLRIINHKFSPKHVKLDKDKGYQAFSYDGQSLDLDLLSSGEQHELVLLHNLLFRVEPGALLLIDEPELSLHVTWQSEFLEDLIKIAKTVGFNAVVATHSPYIVGDRRDLAVQLGQPE